MDDFFHERLSVEPMDSPVNGSFANGWGLPKSRQTARLSVVVGDFFAWRRAHIARPMLVGSQCSRRDVHDHVEELAAADGVLRNVDRHEGQANGGVVCG